MPHTVEDAMRFVLGIDHSESQDALLQSILQRVRDAATACGMTEDELRDWVNDLGWTEWFWSDWEFIKSELNEIPEWLAQAYCASESNTQEGLPNSGGLKWLASFGSSLARGAEGAIECAEHLDALSFLPKQDRQLIAAVALLRSLSSYGAPGAGSISLTWAMVFRAAVTQESARKLPAIAHPTGTCLNAYSSLSIGWRPSSLSASDYEVYRSCRTLAPHHKLFDPRHWDEYRQHGVALVQVALDPLADRHMRALSWYVAFTDSRLPPPDLPVRVLHHPRVADAIEERTIADKSEGEFPRTQAQALRDAFAVAGVEAILSAPAASGRRTRSLANAKLNESLRVIKINDSTLYASTERDALSAGTPPDQAASVARWTVTSRRGFHKLKSLEAVGAMKLPSEGPVPESSGEWTLTEAEAKLKQEVCRLHLTSVEHDLYIYARHTLREWINSGRSKPLRRSERESPTPPRHRMAKSRLRRKAVQAGCEHLVQLLDVV